MSLIEEEAELIVLPIGTVLLGPDWHSEVWQKYDTDLWSGIGCGDGWSSRSLLPRGPFKVLHTPAAEEQR